MPVPTSIADLSTTAASNSPAGSDSIGTSLDDFLRSIQAILKQSVSQGTDITSAATITPAADGHYFTVNGSTGITAIGSTNSWNGRLIALRFASTPTITHNGSTLILPGGSNITAASGDVACFVQESSGVWRCVEYFRAASTVSTLTVGTSANNLVQLNGSGQLPAVDGSQLTGVSAGGKVQDFRLTLTSGTPVTTSDVTAATTIYCTPHNGNQIALYTGSAWVVRTSAEFSIALGTLTSGKPYDVFCYDNAGTPKLEFLAWTSDTARATALAYQDGVLVKSGAATRRYLGTFYTTSATTTEDSSKKRYLYNYYNRARRLLKRLESTSTWNYTTATFRQANGSTANQVEFIQGVVEDSIEARVLASCANGGATASVQVAIGLDSTTTPSGTYSYGRTDSSGGNANASYCDYPGLGRHYLAWLEYSQAVGTTTWYGSTQAQSGIQGSLMA